MYDGIRTFVSNENIELELIPVKKNSEFLYDPDNKILFKGRAASQREKKTYRLQAGVNATTDGVYIYSSNMPNDIKPGDKVKYLGQVQTVESVGYYFDNTGLLNESLFDEEYIIARCPKGITLGK